ncbi:hypothetical protein ACTJKC_02255 [Pedobacter sp. 22226]|uniref:hypothetical protein n=1 Tax=Pedobacter sp. 22226 TaxID=3453894 RepID=UPI003F8260EC
MEAEVQQQCGEILAALLEQVPLIPVKQGRMCIRQHQHFLGLMSDQLDKAEKGAIADGIQHTLNRLIDDLKLYFPSLFDYSASITRPAFEFYRPVLSQLIAAATDLLTANGTEPEITEMLSSLSTQLLDGRPRVSYGQAKYLTDFFTALEGIINGDTQHTGTSDILFTMVSLGFNHPYFYHFCCGYFNGELEKCENIADRYSMLNFMDKTLLQLPERSEKSFNQKLPPIRESLSRYIQAELGYLKTLESTATDLQGEGFQQGSFRVGFTVRQLALFVRLQVESEIIIAQSPKALHRYVTRHYSTVEKENISEKSFKNAYYSAMGNDVEKVIDRIAAMLAIAQEKY